MNQPQILEQQAACLELRRQGLNFTEIAAKTGLSRHAARRRVAAAEKRERLDPELAQQLADKGVHDLAGLHSGWLLNKDSSGSGSSLYFYLGPDEEKINFADAVIEALSDIPRLPPIEKPPHNPEGTDFANWIFLADLHVGGEYGSRLPEEDFNRAIDDLVSRMPPAEKAVICELGDLLDANDHKAVTPASGNPTDTIRDDHLGNTLTAVRWMKYAAYRMLETHEEVDFYMVRGNHDETAFIAVLVGLAEHFADNPRVTIHVPKCPEEEEFLVVSWGECAFFPHHGDKAKFAALKDVWTDQFPDEWALAKMWRLIATGHYHTLKIEELVGAEGRQFGTLHRPNRWARMQGYFSRGRLSVLTVHKEGGLVNETISNIKPTLRGKVE